jgi:hypothetical protein
MWSGLLMGASALNGWGVNVTRTMTLISLKARLGPARGTLTELNAPARKHAALTGRPTNRLCCLPGFRMFRA